ncbi:hypothetical protein F442_13434 [Phytophthora nicotianae P10297]|uniref:Uncharacterized protein n=1 Tax=Phytophthora nicotianae P10297 TaxID=1317064 RepID=W2YYP0_PHYNI|nr:hypothetical protein F442_13434 [Phytophthora nicotianae P10297]
MKTLKTTGFVVKTAEADFSTPLAATVPMIRVAVSHDMVSFSTCCV